MLLHTRQKKLFFPSLRSGFTLIELLVVFVVMSVLMATGVVSFASYGRNQTFKNSVTDITSYLNLAKSRSLSKAKPSQCTNKTLNFYQVRIVAPGSTYQMQAMCDSTLYTLETKSLPANITFSGATPITINFAVATGVTIRQQTITITGYGNTSIITVTQTGVISVR